jgi:fibro-slime domain-containing protein
MKKLLFILIILVMALSLSLPASAATPPDPIDIPVTIRDFHGVGWLGGDGYAAHPDFEYTIATDPGIVLSALGGDKKPVYAGLAGNPTTHSQADFDQWYRDTANVNTPLATTLTFTWDGSKYYYDNSNFFPIDGQLLGNDGRSHNYHFTLEMHTKFTYQGGEVFSFTGDDDLWLFINDQLVIDLGGVHSALSASVSLNSLGLTAGEEYDFDLFFAERHTTESNFRAETTILLEEPERYCIEGNKINNDSGLGIPGWTITLQDATGAEIATTTTNSTGGYEFCRLLPGDYTVCEVSQLGWTNVSPTCINVEIIAANITDVDFLNVLTSAPTPPPVEVGGVIYPTDKAMMLIPLVALVVALLSGTMLVFRRKRIHS